MEKITTVKITKERDRERENNLFKVVSRYVGEREREKRVLTLTIFMKRMSTFEQPININRQLQINIYKYSKDG